MVLTLAIILSFFLPSPANVGILVLGAIGEVGEIVWGRRLARRWRPRTGVETMIGATAVVVTPCQPNGQVRVDGTLWEAHCAAGAEVGDTVRIVSLDGLTLSVSPAPDPGERPPAASDPHSHDEVQ